MAAKQPGVSQLVPRILVSIAVSAVVLGVVLLATVSQDYQSHRATFLRLLTDIPLGIIGLYAGTHLFQTWFRAARYRVLLTAATTSAAEVPTIAHVFLVTAARNMFVDLLPARLGELSYVVMLNKGYRVPADACISSLGISVFFDLVALVLLASAAAVPYAMFAADAGAIPIGAVVVGTLVCAGGVAGFVLAGRLHAWLLDLSQRASNSLTRKIVGFLASVAMAVEHTREAGVFLHVLALSFLVRIGKYSGLYILFAGVTGSGLVETLDPPVLATLFAFVSAEAAASLPAPAFMGFGVYEAGGTLALTSLGYSPASTVLVMLGVHIYSQLVDYSIGTIALILFFFYSRIMARRSA